MRQYFNLAAAPLKITLVIVLLVGMLVFLPGCASTYSRQSVGVAVEYSSDNVDFLAAYGEWVNLGFYGLVWRPYVVTSWEPFYYGHWVWSGDGWVWVSYEPYGWLVYHYGYWDYDPGIGWFWIPGEVWSPAQVQWVVYADYVAWTPLPPPGVSRPRIWDSPGIRYWNIVTIRDFTRENVGRYIVKTRFKKDQQSEEYVSNHFPEAQMVEKYTHSRVPSVTVERQPVRVQDKQYQKIVLPADQAKKVDKHQPQVERKVLRPQKSGQAPGQELEKKKDERGSKKNRAGQKNPKDD